MADAENIVSGMAGRYAAALFSIAKDQGAIDAVASDLKRFSALTQESADLRLLIRSPAFKAEEQSRALGAVLQAAGIGGLTAKFLGLVASKRRLFALPDMITGFNKLVDAERGVARATVTVAEPLDGSSLAAVRDALAASTGGKSIEVDVKVDPEIIGGIVVRLGSRMIDASIKTKLNSIRTRMKEVG